MKWIFPSSRRQTKPNQLGFFHTTTGGRLAPGGQITEYIFLLEMKHEQDYSVSARSAGAYTATLLVMVNVMKGGGRSPQGGGIHGGALRAEHGTISG